MTPEACASACDAAAGASLVPDASVLVPLLGVAFSFALLAPAVLSWRALESDTIFRFLVVSEITGWIAVAGSVALIMASIADSPETYTVGWVALVTGGASVVLAGLMAWLIWLLFRHLHHLMAVQSYDD